MKNKELIVSKLSKYDNSWYNPGRNLFVRSLWFMINVLFFINQLNPFSNIKIWFLRLFGAEIGKGVVIKPGVNIKYPWNVSIGDFSWIGEKVWIDSLGKIIIGSNCCLSQGAMLLTGNHDYSSATFDLKVLPITLEDGVWLGANSLVSPGIICGSHSVLIVNSVASKNLEPYGIYRGNPAEMIRKRVISENQKSQ